MTTTDTFQSSSNITSEYNMDGSLDESKTIGALVQQSPAVMNVNEYTKLCRNILKYNKNVILTANFHSFDTSLIVSNEIQSAFENSVNEIAMANLKVGGGVNPKHNPNSEWNN